MRKREATVLATALILVSVLLLPPLHTHAPEEARAYLSPNSVEVWWGSDFAVALCISGAYEMNFSFSFGVWFDPLYMECTWIEDMGYDGSFHWDNDYGFVSGHFGGYPGWPGPAYGELAVITFRCKYPGESGLDLESAMEAWIGTETEGYPVDIPHTSQGAYVSQRSGTAFVDPAATHVRQGSNFTVTISVSDAYGMNYGFSFGLGFDIATMECINVTETGYGGSFTWNNNQGGVWGSLGGYPDWPGPENGALALITFRCKGEGRSDLWLQSIMYASTEGGEPLEIPHNDVWGVVLQYRSSDLNVDGIVDALDLQIFNEAYGSELGKPEWNSICDLQPDRKIDARDLYFMGRNFTGDMVAHWKFDEGSGIIAADTSGCSNHGTLCNNVVWVDGKYGKALSFDGLDDYVLVNDRNSLHFSTSVTLMAWIYLPAGASYVGDDYILGKQAENGGTHLALGIHNNTGHIAFALGVGWGEPSIHQYSTNGVSRDTWTHIAATYNGSVMKIYINGVLDSSLSWTSGFSSNSNPLTIGSKNPPYVESFITASIDEVKVFNKALTQEEVQAQMAG